MNGEEKRLIKKAKEGDREAFGELIKMNAEKIYNLSYKLTGEEQEAKDLPRK